MPIAHFITPTNVITDGHRIFIVVRLTGRKFKWNTCT